MSVRIRSLALFAVVLLAAFVIMSLQRPPMVADDSAEPLVPVSQQAVGFAVSPPIRDLPRDTEVSPPDLDAPEEEMELRLEFRPPAMDAGAGSRDRAIFTGSERSWLERLFPKLKTPPTLNMSDPLVSFEGLGTVDNGSTVHPPDTVGDVGPNYYVQMTNVRFRVWDKAGNPLVPAQALSALFGPLGSRNRCSNVNDGDPVVVYDPLADRWLLSQFCVSVANPNNHQLIAISQTSDPTGAYYLYDFMMPNNKFNDYPHFGVWSDAYYMTDHQFNQPGTLWLGQGVFALDRAKMIAGDPTASYIYFDLFSLDPDLGGMLPADLDGLNPPPLGGRAYFMSWRADEYGDPADALQLFEFHADFANPAASTFIERPESRIPVPAFDPRANLIEQPGAPVSAYLDTIGDRFMHRLAYRHIGGEESLVVTHTVNVGPDPSTAAGHQAAPRYYELRRTLPGGPFTLANTATYAPDTDNRWIGSAAQDHQGDVAIGYSVSSLTVSPSIRYAGRLAGDPPNGLFQGEATLIAGTGSQLSTADRWGDYSAMSVDPADDCTFWYTQEYYDSIALVNWQTRIGSFKFAECAPVQKGTLSGTITNCSSGALISGAQVNATGGYLRSTGAPGTYSMTTVPGTYGVTVARAGYQPAAATGFVVSDGGTTDASLCLVPIAVVTTAGSTGVSAEGCAPVTGGMDPGETVSVSFPLRNTGAADTVDLIATLVPGGGVLSPSGPQSYGALAAGGAAVSRTFTFTVDPGLACGGKLTATLSLMDGSTDLGTMSFPLMAGEYFHESFDNQAAPFLPAGWTDSAVGGAPPPAWIATNITGYFASAPNGMFTGSSGSVSERRLETPTIAVPLTSSQLTFKNNFSLSTGADGAVLEISINGGGYVDIIIAGGLWVTGAYNGTIGTGTGSPIAGRPAWTGGNTAGSNGFITSTVILPFTARGQNVKLRWRAAFNNSGSQLGGGWRIDDVSLYTSACCGSIVVASSPTAVTGESCSPANGGGDPDETVTVSLPLLGTGTAATSNLVASLLPGGGVNAPGGPQAYGVITPGGPAVARNFTFVPGGACGGTVTATLALQDGSTPLGTRSFTLTLGGTATILSENFDSVTAPALPAGWVATRPVGASPPLWATSSATTDRVSPPNGAMTAGAGVTAVNLLDSPVFAVPGGVSAQLSFNNSWSFEDGYDGGVLEISINGGPFTDILDAGGSFVSGGYSGEISFEVGGPLAGRLAWTGSDIFGSNGFVTTKVNLPPSALGSNVQLRWRAGFDEASNPAGAGWRIDNVLVTAISCCTQACTLGCPSDIVAGNDSGLCGKSVSFSSPTVIGSCGAVAAVPASGSFFAVGATAAGATGNSVSGGGTKGTCGFLVTVNDVEAPALSVALTPDPLWPPYHQMIHVTAAVGVQDNCGATAVLSALASSEPDDAPGDGDGHTVNDIQNALIGTPDFSFDLRAERGEGGPGRVYTATYTATDTSSNTAVLGGIAPTPHDLSGVTEPVSLSVAGTTGEADLSWNSVPGALHYNVIRGNVSSLADAATFIDLGTVTCLASSTSLTNLTDTDLPGAGSAFFYLVSYNDGLSSTYGAPTAPKPRVPVAGDCP